MMPSRLLGLTPWFAVAVAAFAACSSPTPNTTIPMGTGSSSGSATSGGGSGTTSGTGGTNSGTGATTSGATSGAGTGSSAGAGSGSTVGTGSGASSGATTSGATSGAGSGASTGTIASGGSGASTGTIASGGSGGSSGSGGHPHTGSPGCGKAWTGATGMWVSQPAGCAAGNNNQGNASCQTIQGVSGWSAPGVVIQTPNPKNPSVETSDEQRGWWVLVPKNYNTNNTTPYRVIYGFAGCGDTNYFNAGNSGYDYEGVDGDNAIQVGADYDTFSDVPTCYDNRTPTSNDFAFVPWLMNTIENEFCVDVDHQYVSGYSSGGWVAQQMNCAYPDKFRGEVVLTGCEPGGGGEPGSQPPCVNKPTAMIYVHDLDDTANPYACMIPGCARMLKQNGCSVTTCNPLDTTTTTPYTPPPGVTVPGGHGCVSFNGCPSDYPVVFCVLQGTQHGDSQTSWGITKLFWDFMSNKLAD
jgi:poly(3-hydroxybutyrate) depolymerase